MICIINPFKSVLVFIIAILSIIHNSFAEEGVDTQLWGDFNAYYKINDKWESRCDLGGRTLHPGHEWNRIYLHPSFNYQWKLRLALRGGLRFIYTHEEGPSNTFELRPWQGLRLIWPQTSYLILDHYARLEERITFYTEAGGSDLALRLRYRLQAKTPNLRIEAINQIFYLLTSFEFFFDIGSGIFESYANRNRLSFGLGYFIAQSSRAELIYTRQAGRDSRGTGFNTTLHIFRLRLRYYLNY